MIMETYYQRQIRTDRKVKELDRKIGDILYDNWVERRYKPLQVITLPPIKIDRRKEDLEAIPLEEIEDALELDGFNKQEVKRPNYLTDRCEHLNFWYLGKYEIQLKENPLNRLEKAESPKRTPKQE